MTKTIEFEKLKIIDMMSSESSVGVSNISRCAKCIFHVAFVSCFFPSQNSSKRVQDIDD